jgi:hypothetical protein
MDVNMMVFSMAGLAVSATCLAYGVKLYMRDHPRSKQATKPQIKPETKPVVNMQKAAEDEEDLLTIGQKLVAALEGGGEHA